MSVRTALSTLYVQWIQEPANHDEAAKVIRTMMVEETGTLLRLMAPQHVRGTRAQFSIEGANTQTTHWRVDFMPEGTLHDTFLKGAIALASEARAAGNHPFGAVLVIDGAVALTARNTVNTDGDPTAHAETNLVAEAVRTLTREQLTRSVLYTSCEPCAMCVGKMYWAGIRTIVYALPAEELAKLAGGSFLVPCRELLARAIDPVSVIGPLLVDDARTVHEGFWA
jgi:tRNA(Arg) A34 adenosine deaminase TadA